MTTQQEYFGRRDYLQTIGKEAEESVGSRLSFLFGHRNVSRGVDGFSTGKDGYPDIQINYKDNLMFVEVKSIQGFVKDNNRNKANYVKMEKDAFIRLVNRAKAKIATIIMIVELRLIGDNVYFLLNYDEIEAFYLKGKGETILIPLSYLLGNCKNIEYKESEFIVSPIETNQIRI